MSGRSGADEEKTRYVYLLRIDNRGAKSRYFGQQACYYVGETDDLPRRFLDHLRGIDSKFLRNNFPLAQKRLVFVKTLHGTLYDAMGLEWRLKRLGARHKDRLVESRENELIACVPGKVIVLRGEEGDTVLRFPQW